MILEILKYPDPRLRKKGLPVVAVDAEMTQLAADMLETMYDSSGIGLAAPQVGKIVRLLVVDTRPKDDDGVVLPDEMTELEREITQPLAVFNPEIIRKENKTSYDEGCLSVPGFYETVERAEYVEVKCLGLDGVEIVLKTDGLLSICLQHEMDHLDGKLFIDRLSVIKSTRIKSRIKKLGYPTAEEVREEQRRKRDLHAQDENGDGEKEEVAL